MHALQACYADLLSLAPVEAAALVFAERVLARGAVELAHDVPALSGTLTLADAQLAGAPVALKFVLPRAGGAASLQVATNAPRAAADTLQQLASSTADECARDGVPCLLLAADELMAAVRDMAAADASEQRQHAAAQLPATDAAASGGSSRELVLSRRCVWFHHMLAEKKRKAIVEWGRELRLGGWSKPGYPGVLLVEVSV